MAAPFFMVGPVQAAEIIRNFEVSASIQYDGTVDIYERITVDAEGKNIRRGIYRDIPTIFKDAQGRVFHMPFDVKSVMRDNQEEVYSIVHQSNGKRIYIGSTDKNVSYGTHAYDIHYRVARVIGRFSEGDEFYWNVTGHGWVFPIYKASIIVAFPDDVKITKATAYTGPQGSRGRNYQDRILGNEYQAVTTKGLSPGEGFTVAVAVPAGTIAPETTWQQIKYYFQLHSIALIWFSFAFLSIVYLIQAWVRYGRDPKGVVVPRFDVPQNISADMLRYIDKQTYDIKAFTALLIEAASQRAIKIEDVGRRIVLTRQPSLITSTSPGMSIVHSAFGYMDSISLPKRSFLSLPVDQETAEKLRGAQMRHHVAITQDSKTYIDKNLGYTGRGLMIGVLGAIWALFMSVSDDEKFFLAIGSVVFYALIFKLFARIMPQYTDAGRAAKDHAEGLRMYMKTAEEERWNKLYPKDMTPEKFEKLLPYAIALGVDQEWCDYMDRLVKEGLVVPSDSGLSNGWMYSHSHLGNLSSSINAISSSISSAATPPGSSSGFGGGGGSGGGGGGGGGGGW